MSITPPFLMTALESEGDGPDDDPGYPTVEIWQDAIDAARGRFDDAYQIDLSTQHVRLIVAAYLGALKNIQDGLADGSEFIREDEAE